MDNFVKRTPKPKEVNEISPFTAERNARQIVNHQSKAPTLDDVTALLRVVREEEGVKAEIQQLQFTEKFPLHDYKLVQLPKEILNIMKAGDKLVFRGDRQDEVALCTASSTYLVKEVETSNSLLILPTLKAEMDVGDTGEKHLTIAPINTISQHYLELQKIPCVSIHKLRDLLQLNRLPWDWLTNDSSNDSYSMEMLLDHVQMSEGELISALREMPVVEHNGKLRWLSNDLQDKLLNLIVEAFDDLSMPSINITHLTASNLRAFLPENVTDAVIDWFLEKMCSKTEEGDYNVNPEPFVRARAAQLLRAVAKLEMTTFEKLLDEMLPVGITMQPSHLLGICVHSENVRGKFISYLSAEDLPENPRARLDVLFSMQKLWTLEEVSPFLRDICSNSKDMEVLMYGMCRSLYREDGTKCFCSLRPV
ncbi:hypothetical protein GCK32_011291 [Trichostrongylus colubriformis]|uniref:Sister chromatid cohesion protein DCC1 n=1 Tax=Trichostrongylus colubriformis TaxID=6319 RepID=A0AAN8ICW0_TRICO